jgi:hypothetical protein
MASTANKLSPLHRAWILTIEDRMGTVNEHLHSNVTEPLITGYKEGVELKVTKILEDFRAVQRLVMSFPAASVNGLQGYFLLTVQPQSQGSVRLRQAELNRSEDRLFARVHIKSDVQVEGRWAYSRHPETRTVALTAFDDPSEVFEAERLHRSEFSDSLQATFQLAGLAEWTWQEIELQSSLIKASESLDKCEALLDYMDRKFRKKGADPLRWQEELVTMESMEAAAAESETDTMSGQGYFNIVLEYDNRELVRGKRIQPIVRYPVTLIGAKDTLTSAILGCSIAD